jgi:hypothetical protein
MSSDAGAVLKFCGDADVVGAEMWRGVTRWSLTEARYRAWSKRAEDARVYTGAIPAVMTMAGSIFALDACCRRGRSLLVSIGASMTVGTMAGCLGVGPMWAVDQHLRRQAQAYAIAAHGSAIQAAKWVHVYNTRNDLKPLVADQTSVLIKEWDAMHEYQREKNIT